MMVDRVGNPIEVGDMVWWCFSRDDEYDIYVPSIRVITTFAPDRSNEILVGTRQARDLDQPFSYYEEVMYCKSTEVERVPDDIAIELKLVKGVS